MSSTAGEPAPNSDRDDTVFPVLKHVLTNYYRLNAGQDPAERELVLLRRYAAEGDTGEFEGLLDEMRVAIRTPAVAAALVRETTGAETTPEETQAELEKIHARLLTGVGADTSEDAGTSVHSETDQLTASDAPTEVQYFDGGRISLPLGLLPGRTIPLWAIAVGSAALLAVATWAPLPNAVSLPISALSLIVLAISATVMHRPRYRDVAGELIQEMRPNPAKERPSSDTATADKPRSKHRLRRWFQFPSD